MSIQVTSNIDVKVDEVLAALDPLARGELAGKTKQVYVFNNNKRHEIFVLWRLDEKLGSNAKDGLERGIVKAWEEVHGNTPRVYVSDSFKL
ncbi:hypothetical protein OAL66_01790 [bacterium]|nr:hypothetical protein [bacterium]